MTVYELRKKVNATGSFFFKPDTMKFFGDTMKNYGVRERTITTTDGEQRRVYELRRKKPVRHGLQDSAFFDAETFERVWEAK